MNDSNSNQYHDGTSADLTGAEGDVMVYFPEFWYLGENTSTGWTIYISETEVDGWIHVNPSLVGAYFYTEEPLRDEAYLRSISGVAKCTDNDTNLLRRYASNRGTGFHIMDYQQHCIIAWMFMLRYKTRNSISILGNSQGSTVTSGSTNSLGMTDTTPSKPSSTKVNFLGIEGIYDNDNEVIEGIHLHYNDGLIVYDKGGYDLQYSDPSYSAITQESKRIVYSDSNDLNGVMMEMRGGKYFDITPVSTASSRYFSGRVDIYRTDLATYDVGISGYYEGNTGIFSMTTNMGYRTARLAFDGTITVVDDVDTFKSITDATLG